MATKPKIPLKDHSEAKEKAWDMFCENPDLTLDELSEKVKIHKTVLSNHFTMMFRRRRVI